MRIPGTSEQVSEASEPEHGIAIAAYNPVTGDPEMHCICGLSFADMYWEGVGSEMDRHMLMVEYPDHFDKDGREIYPNKDDK